jgi:hypothetical protein
MNMCCVYIIYQRRTYIVLAFNLNNEKGEGRPKKDTKAGHKKLKNKCCHDLVVTEAVVVLLLKPQLLCCY